MVLPPIFIISKYNNRMNFMKDNPDTLYFSEDETHYLKSAETMIELDKEREELAKARAVSNRVTNLGFGDALRKRVAQYAGVRDDVRGSKVPKRKRNDAHDFRNDLVDSFVPDYGYNVGDGTAFGDGMTMIEHGTHQPRWLGSGYKTSDNTYLQYAHNNRDNMGLIFLSRTDIDPKFHKATLINQTKKKKRKHENDPGFRGY